MSNIISQLCTEIKAGRVVIFDTPLLKSNQVKIKPCQRDLILDYAHCHCHMWSLALMSICADLDLMIFKRGGDIIHSAAGSKQADIFFDANGIYRIAQIKQYWQDISDKKITVKQIKTSDLEKLIHPERCEMDKTIADIETWLHLFVKPCSA